MFFIKSLSFLFMAIFFIVAMSLTKQERTACEAAIRFTQHGNIELFNYEMREVKATARIIEALTQKNQ